MTQLKQISTSGVLPLLGEVRWGGLWEADVSYYAAERKTYLDLLKQYYLADTTVNAIQSLIQLLSYETDIESRYEIVFAQLANKDTTAAILTLNNIEQILPENNAEIVKYNQLKVLIPLMHKIENEGKAWKDMDANDKAFIKDLSDNNNELPGMLSKSLRLHFDDTFNYEEPIYTDENQELKMAMDNKVNKPMPISDKQSFKVSPNPANDFVVISYEISKNMNGLKLLICNTLGKMVYEKELNKPKDELLISLKAYVRGNYIATLFNNGEVIKSAKIVVQ